MLHTPLAGQNHLFLRFNKFFRIFPSLREKRKESRTKKCFFCYFLRYFTDLMIEKDVKSCFSIKKLIWTSKRHTEHLFAGLNAQQSPKIKIKLDSKMTIMYFTISRKRSPTQNKPCFNAKLLDWFRLRRKSVTSRRRCNSLRMTSIRLRRSCWPQTRGWRRRKKPSKTWVAK